MGILEGADGGGFVADGQDGWGEIAGCGCPYVIDKGTGQGNKLKARVISNCTATSGLPSFPPLLPVAVDKLERLRLRTVMVNILLKSLLESRFRAKNLFSLGSRYMLGACRLHRGDCQRRYPIGVNGAL
mmetsp:Transcript_17722/g.32187  ORF Transcript_17722/g.32187 Transcript_17722/m.32187 type:complete len:129 (-) Transcript_17722:305-691(-)